MVDRLYYDTDLAALYDVWWPSQRRDFGFYLPLMMSAEAVLDAGCGTGTLLHEARQSGHTGRLCGLDPAAGMLAQARKWEDIEWVLGDLRSIAWVDQFDLVVMTGHAFQALIEDDELRTSLAAIRVALTKDGRVAFETRNPLARAWERWTPESAVEVTDTEGTTVRITTQVEAPFDGSTVSFTHIFTSLAWPKPQISRSTLRFLDANLLSSFLIQAGFVIEEQFGDWDRQPLTDTSPEIITLAPEVARTPGTLTIGMERFLAAAFACRFGALDIQIHHDRVLSASDDHGLTRHVWTCVDFLMRDVGRDVDEVSWAGLITELQAVAPAHSRTPPDHVKHSLQLAMVVCARFCIRLNNHGAGPQLTGSGARVSNGSGARHSRGLGRVGVQFIGVHDLHAMFFPIHRSTFRWHAAEIRE